MARRQTRNDAQRVQMIRTVQPTLAIMLPATGIFPVPDLFGVGSDLPAVFATPIPAPV